jgi:hypothetical protein
LYLLLFRHLPLSFPVFRSVLNSQVTYRQARSPWTFA